MTDRPMMTSFDELEANLGSGEDEAPKEEFRPFFMSRLEIAEQAFEAMRGFDVMASSHEGSKTWLTYWEKLSDEQKEEYADIALLALKMQAQPEEDFGRMVHSKRAMQFLLKGYTFSEKHDDEKKETHLVAPWESLPHERKAPLLIFKGVVKALFKVWDNDNPLLKRH